jgi:hypothetical protein
MCSRGGPSTIFLGSGRQGERHGWTSPVPRSGIAERLPHTPIREMRAYAPQNTGEKLCASDSMISLSACSTRYLG